MDWEHYGKQTQPMPRYSDHTLQLRWFAVVALVFVGGQLLRAQSTASIEGDVYLTLRNGQLSKVAAATVRLVRADSTASAKQKCGDGARVSDRKRLDSLDAAFTNALIGGTVQSSKTGMQAHYKLDSIAPGSYALWVETRLAISYSWLVPVTVALGHSQTVDLDNSNVTPGVFYCMKD
jgi:hypothetical protein